MEQYSRTHLLILSVLKIYLSMNFFIFILMFAVFLGFCLDSSNLAGIVCCSVLHLFLLMKLQIAQQSPPSLERRVLGRAGSAVRGLGMRTVCFQSSGVLPAPLCTSQLSRVIPGTLVCSVPGTPCTQTQALGQCLTFFWPLNCASKSLPPY